MVNVIEHRYLGLCRIQALKAIGSKARQLAQALYVAVLKILCMPRANPQQVPAPIGFPLPMHVQTVLESNHQK